MSNQTPSAPRPVAPLSTIVRLPRYLSCVQLARDSGKLVINSSEIATRCNNTAAQVRKDLSYVGYLGVRGAGYEVEGLIAGLSAALGVDESRRVAIIGYGGVGKATRDARGLETNGFVVVALFDNDLAKIGSHAAGLIIRPMDELEVGLIETHADMAVLTMPADHVQEIIDRAVAVGVRAFLNTVPASVVLPDGVVMRQICPTNDLLILSYLMSQGSEK